MPVSGVNAIIERGVNVKNVSAAWDSKVPVIAFDKKNEGNAATGDSARFSHAKGKKSATKGRGRGARGVEKGRRELIKTRGDREGGRR